jgi:hypothetical protein
MRLLFLSLFLVSCASPLSQQPSDQDPELVLYLNQFEDMTGLGFTGRTIFSTRAFLQGYGADVIALCVKYTSGEQEIYLDEEFWEQGAETWKQEVLFHELGHCVLNRDHDDTLIKVTEQKAVYVIPKTIMFPYAFGGDFYIKFFDYYTEELAGKDTSLTYTEL